jgi:glycosyltransferase involved in cell wall biosynthesis
MPTVSAIIPTYNRKEWVQRSIDSVLAQRDVDVECIVVDDGSTDGSAEVLRQKYGDRIRYIYQPNQGESVARNRGAKEALGEFLAFLDSDDLWLPEKLALQVQFLLNYPDYGAVYCQATGVDEQEARLNQLPQGAYLKPENFHPTFLIENGLPLGGSTIMVRRNVFADLGGFQETIRHGEDYDFGLRLLLFGTQVGFLQRPLTLIRVHSRSQSLVVEEDRFLEAFRDHCAIYTAVAEKSTDEPIQLAARKAVSREQFKIMIYYIAVCKIEQAQQYSVYIDRVDPHALSNPDLYDHQIEGFTPLIFRQRNSVEDVLTLINRIFEFRNRYVTRPGRLDALVILRASAWCALHGRRREKTTAWSMMLTAPFKHPRLTLSLAYWKLVIRLLFGKLMIQLYFAGKGIPRA